VLLVLLVDEEDVGPTPYAVIAVVPLLVLAVVDFAPPAPPEPVPPDELLTHAAPVTTPVSVSPKSTAPAVRCTVPSAPRSSAPHEGQRTSRAKA
jgi:hypothetical protein